MAFGSCPSFRVHHDGTAAQPAFAATGQSRNCWVARICDLLYVSNVGSPTLTGFRAPEGGRTLTDLGDTPADPGTVGTAAKLRKGTAEPVRADTPSPCRITSWIIRPRETLTDHPATLSRWR